MMIKVEQLGKETIKTVLWRLCYEPVLVLKELDLEEREAKAVREEIIKQCAADGIDLTFAGKEPYLDLLGVDLGITDPVVRDTIIEKCYEVAKSHTEGNIIKIAKLLKTDDDGMPYSQMRIIGGLKEMGFSNEEANYLFKTCNLHPVSILLSRLLNSRKSSTKATYIPMEPATSDDDPAVKILNNKELIEKVFSLAGQERNEEEVKEALNEAKKEVERLEKLKETINTLKEKGISFEDVLDKEDIINKIFLVIAQL